jgi:hypothetical protein
MNPSFPSRVVRTVLFAAGVALTAEAQVAPPQPASKDSAAPAPAPRRRAISPEVAAQLSAVTPKYTPPAPKPPPTPEEEQIDLREVDKPRNGIVRLPKYIVQEEKPPVFSDRVIHTKKGLADLAVRRYMSEADRALNRFTLPLFGTSMEARAMAMYEEQERLDNMGKLRDNAVDARKSDPAGGEYIRRESQKTFLRSSDFGWQGSK